MPSSREHRITIPIRQPVVLERRDWGFWLDPEVTQVDVHRPLLVPTIAGTLIHHPVSKDVGNVCNNTSDLVEAIDLGGDPGLISLWVILP